MSANFRAEHLDLAGIQFTPELLQCIPAKIARKFRLLPISQSEIPVSIAMADPSDLNAVEFPAQHFNREIYIYASDEGEVDALSGDYMEMAEAPRKVRAP